MHELLDGLLFSCVLFLLQISQVLFGCLQKGGEGVGLADEVVLYLLQHFLLALLQSTDSGCRISTDDLLDVAIEQFDRKKHDFVVDPVGLAFMEGLHYLVVSFLLSLAVVFEQVDQIALLEITAYPVLLGCVSEDAVALEDAVFELADVEITVFEPFLAEAVQLRIRHVSSFDDFQLEFVLVSVGIGVVASMTASKDDSKAESIDESSFFKAYGELIAILLSLDIVNFIEIVLHDPEMRASDEKIEFSQIEHSIKQCEIVLLFFFEHHSLLEDGIGDGLVGIVEQFALSLKLALSVEVEMSQKAIGSIYRFYEFPLHKFCGEEAVLCEEYIMSVHEIVEVGGGNGESAVVEEDSFAVLLE